ncbi:hypothetical protein SAMN05421858_1891 [Haladaptatus litoreus]|uniref:Uncharacterized protein n=1 Tax=Haladaptatus litoreus TaxID=553468 RepID=A0A1N6Z6F0_9EURY|nr:hypothetical protein [Haladaptatus litoreus]SIR22366.1 hypothetical protein SAMN05421858_1891 [Haladaptatus litoreus]
MWLYLVGKLAIVAVYYLVRLVPVVGLKLSDRYEHELFGPLVDDLSVADVRAERNGESGSDSDSHQSGRSVVVELGFDNDSTLDARIIGGTIRFGHTEGGETACNLVWTDDFDSLPKNIGTSKIESEGSGTLRLERRFDGDELHVDGELRLRRIVTIRDRELPFGVTSFTVPEQVIHVGGDSEKSDAEAKPRESTVER